MYDDSTENFSNYEVARGLMVEIADAHDGGRNLPRELRIAFAQAAATLAVADTVRSVASLLTDLPDTAQLRNAIERLTNSIDRPRPR